MTEKDPAAVALGRKGGRAKSDAKTAAARANAAKGGRPPLPAAVRIERLTAKLEALDARIAGLRAQRAELVAELKGIWREA